MLSKRLDHALPGRSAQRQFAHELSYGRHFWQNAHEAVPAAVAVVLMQYQDQWQLPLTLRPTHLPSHAGQVCLPGGRLELGESAEQAALREVQEELNLPQACLNVLGQLSPLYLYVSNFYVTPFVTVFVSTPTTPAYAIAPNPAEVAELIWLPLRDLIDPSKRKTSQYSSEAHADVRFQAPYFDIYGHRVWGATAMMLSELAAVLSD